MTIKVLQRDTCPKTWHIGHQIEWQGEVLELIEINEDKYIWVDVCKTNTEMKQQQLFAKEIESVKK